MNIIQKKLEDLKPYEKNPRKNDHAVDRIANAIKEFGFNVPILIEGDGKIIDGHLRYKAAITIGMERVPCVVIDELSPNQIKALRLSINKMADLADWDYDLLAEELEQLQDIDFELELTGFDDTEIEELLKCVENECVNNDEPTIDIRHVKIDDLAPTTQELDKLSGKTVLVEYSGGKDSTATAIWAKKYLPGSEIILCYVDLGADYIGMQKYLVGASEYMGLTLKILKSKQNIFVAFLDNGAWPHFHHPYCHDILHDALDTELLEYDPAEIVVLRGGRATEKASKSNKADNRFLIVPRNEQYLYFQPLYYSGKELCEQILADAGVPMWEGYKNGLQRTACRICPGQKPRAYAVIRAEYPDIWAEIKFLAGRLKYGAWTQAPDGSPGEFEELADRGVRQLAKEGICL